MNLFSSLQSILNRYNLTPDHLLGQNFLINEEALAKIIGAADLKKSDVVLEVGPGTGILTKELAKNAGSVIALEKDRRMIAILKEILRDHSNVKIIEGDILKINIAEILQNSDSLHNIAREKITLNPPLQKEEITKTPSFKRGINDISGAYKIIANIPYYLTSPLIRLFLENEPRPQEMVILIQKEVAERIANKGGDTSVLSILVQFYGAPEIVSIVKRESFWPIPDVDSAIIKISDIKKPEEYDEETTKKFFRLVKIGFSGRRKTLANNLSAGLKIEKNEITSIIVSLGLPSAIRAQELTIEQWKTLYNMIKL